MDGATNAYQSRVVQSGAKDLTYMDTSDLDRLPLLSRERDKTSAFSPTLLTSETISSGINGPLVTHSMAAGEFDYDALDPELQEHTRAAAVRIRDRLKRNLIETGRDLIGVKERLGHGLFGAWLKAEFNMSERSAERYMNAARLLAKSDIVSDLPPTVIHVLSAPSAPSHVVDELLEAAKAGHLPPFSRMRIQDQLCKKT